MTQSTGNARSRGKRKTEVPGQALGYGLQYTRLLQLLLKAPPGTTCSVEYLDDVAQEGRDGVVLTQSKSALTANPVADRANSLWKTLSNWVVLAADGGCDPDRTEFEIYVSRPVSGALADAFSAANTPEAALEALQLARTMLWGKAPKHQQRDQVAAGIVTYVDNVLCADPVLAAKVIQNFKLTCSTGSPQADIEAILRTHPISHSKIGDIADHLAGIVKRRVDEMLEKEQPAIISRDEFWLSYTAYVQKVDRELVLQSRANRPSEREARGHLPRVFVQQLDLIGLPFEDKLEAVSDYLMASADRTAWAASGEIDATSFDELDNSLKRSWRNKRLACKVAHSNKAQDDQGLALYAACMDVNEAVQQKEAPDHFIPGCLHRLADDLLIGWHPDYLGQLKSNKDA